MLQLALTLNRKLGLLWAALLISISAHAQPPHPPQTEEAREKLEAYRVAFFTRKMSLSADEAKTFWPVYDAFQVEVQKYRKECRTEVLEAKLNFEKLSDAEVETVVDNIILFKEKEAAVMKAYHLKFKSILPIRKVALLYKAERDFKRELLSQIKRE